MKIIIFILIFAMFMVKSSLAQQITCDYKVEILANNTEFEKENFSWRMKATKLEGKSTNITGTAEIEDSNGQIVRKYRPWANEPISKQKTSNEYSPNLKEGQYKITSRINVECDDANKDNNVGIKIIRIKNGNKEISTTINQNNNNNTIIDAKINATIKNETINPLNISRKTQNKTLNEKEPENLTANDEEDNVIQLRDNDKKTNKLTASAVQEPEIVYESSNEKSKNLILFSLLALSILLNIILIWRR